MKPDDIDLQLQHERHGWASARLTISSSELDLNKTQHVFRLTDVRSSPIQALVDAALLLAEGQPQATFTWYDEPGRFEWKFSRIPTAHHLDCLEIRFYSDDAGAKLVKMLTCTVKRSFWLKLVQAELSKLMLLASDADYSKDRYVSELPWDAMQALCGRISA